MLGSNEQSGEKALFPQPIVRMGSEAGPTVLVVAGIHGNEPAGIRAAQIIAGWSVRRGKLVVWSPANPAAVARHQRTIPDVPPEEGDLNRNFVVEGRECRPRGTLARQLWHHVEQIRPDWLVDLHESVKFHKDRGVGNTLIVYPREETVAVAKKLLAKVNQQITGSDEKFVLLRWPARGSLARAAGAVLGCQSFILESTRQDPMEKRVAYHCEFVRALLEELQMEPTARTPK
ncbi:MAG: succinylglutamate desuccinylase/aspartoacylase family protein [Thermogutta sp.]|uniref:succinylglutamate desuccinylase/aspartoacylase domain-containing protein n=1 Tax=Thermogutta sp. TaxID=1962930 RepID=UPI0019B26D8D|nr:succinylglutamate desuccinylase/aspartoacylase family protein [Thermogutta sp.]MBC7352915.1 succinylglutamate desuccinylase/aspartoacylase family protein [Thermogutta sp.]